MSTGPTGPIDHEHLLSLLNGPLGLTGANEYLRTAPLSWTGATGPNEPVVEHLAMIRMTFIPEELPSATVEELETADAAALSVLTATSFDLTPWHDAGSPNSFVLFDIPLYAPCECCDGQSRNCAKYVEYILKQDLPTLIQGMVSTMPGTSISWSSVGGSFRIHVSKAS